VGVRGQSYELELQYELDTKQAKFLSRERQLVARFGMTDSPWRLKAESVLRKNQFDHYASKEFIENELLHSRKYALGIERVAMSEQFYSKLSLDRALGKFPFWKSEFFLAGKVSLFTEKLRLSQTLSGGCVLGGELAINDRLFLHNPLGFYFVGHNEPPNAKRLPAHSVDKFEVGGDDLGSTHYVSYVGRVHFEDIPKLSEFGISPFLFLEALYYPSLKRGRDQNLHEQLKRDTRVSVGLGLSFQIQQVMTLMLYYNAACFNGQPGDKPREGGVGVNFGFF